MYLSFGLPRLPLMDAALRAAIGHRSAAGGVAPADAPPKLDPVQLVLHASVPVKAVIVILVVFSIACWLVIGVKALHISRAPAASRSDS